MILHVISDFLFLKSFEQQNLDESCSVAWNEGKKHSETSFEFKVVKFGVFNLNVFTESKLSLPTCEHFLDRRCSSSNVSDDEQNQWVESSWVRSFKISFESFLRESSKKQASQFKPLEMHFTHKKNVSANKLA